MQNSCMISSLASALYYMGDVHASEYIIRRKQLSIEFIHDKGRMKFLHNTLMGINREKQNQKYIIIFRNEKKPTTFDILQNHSNYPTVSLLLDTEHQTNHCFTVCGKWLFDSIWNLHYHSQKLRWIIYVLVMTLMRLNLLVFCMQLEQSLL